MRRAAAALALVFVATLGVIVPSVSAANGDPKVVIIVGATHGATTSYRTDADRAYVEALKYTSNVVRVYSPNATWANVKAAVAGASIVMYLGHGNGWPSPYTFDPTYSTKDGFGLNATAGNGDYNVKYYGEPSIATLDLAPGAIVLLHHLCYASGNSEPGNAEPSISVARQRADNYASAFIKAGASAVIADGHASAAAYIRPLFTTHQSIENMWKTAPGRNGNIVSFPSVRNPGATVWQDPITPTSGFYRSLTIGSLGVTTGEVISAGYGDTGADPASLVLPGNASVATEGATLYGNDTTAAATETLPAGTRLRVTNGAGATTPEGAELVAVEGIDDPSIVGFMLATDLAARDSAAPIVRGIDAGAAFSPNADGVLDTTTLRGRFTEAVSWNLRVQNGAGDVLFQKTGTGPSVLATWDGLVGGKAVADGTYTVSVTGIDAWANPTASAKTSAYVDTTAPALTAVTPTADATQWFSPNGDAVRETATVTATTNEPGTLLVRILDSTSALVKKWSIAGVSAATAVTWDGRTSAGAYAADGVYTIRVAPQDVAGNTGPAVERSVTLVGALRSVTSSKALFFPHDVDNLAPTTRLNFTLSRPMTVTWTIRDATGAVVATNFVDALQPAGTYQWTFNGRDALGTILPRGRYTSRVTATDGTLTATQTAAFEMDAFVIKPSDTTPARYQLITVKVTSAETLTSARLYITQPGVTGWSIRMTKTGTYSYKATIRLKRSTKTGTMSFRVKGFDTLGGIQSTTRTYTIH